MTEHILEAKDITFGYQKKKPVLEHYDLRVTSRERVALSAPSGFGKTTFCQLLAGYSEPWQGQILLDGEPLPKKGYCPVQMIWQHPERSVDPAMRIGDTLKQCPHLDPAVIEGLGIEKDWYSRFPGELSGGEIQRFCIACALGEETKFIIADEISTMLDLITQSQIWQFLLKETERRNIGMILVSHSEALTNLVATRVLDLTAKEAAKE